MNGAQNTMFYWVIMINSNVFTEPGRYFILALKGSKRIPTNTCDVNKPV